MANSVQLLDEIAMNRALTRISFEITEKADDINDLVLLGIKTRGVPMANRIVEKINEHNNINVPVANLDITFYRDDLSKLSDMPKVNNVLPNIDVTDKEVVIVDDVIYTGRTTRAAIEAIFKMGRPKKISLAVLVDRVHREIPIKADYVGKNVPTSRSENVKCKFMETDGVNEVKLLKRD